MQDKKLSNNLEVDNEDEKNMEEKKVPEALESKNIEKIKDEEH